MLHPLNDFVLLKRDDRDDKIGSIHIPDAAREKSMRAEVMAVGPGRRSEQGVRMPIDVAVGDLVLCQKGGGQEVTIDGERFVLVREHELLGRFES